MIYKGIIIDEGKIIKKQFKVYIPQLIPNMTNDDTIETVQLKVERVTNKSVFKKSTLSRRAYIEALNISDYPTSMTGVNVFEMERVDGVTTVETSNTGEGSNAAADWSSPDTFTPIPMNCLYNGSPHISHVHRIMQGMKFYAMKLTNMNNVDIKKGTECLVMLNGNSAYIIQFIGVFSQTEEDYDYVKK